MTELQKLLYKNLYQKSFYEFVKGFWSTCEPAKMVDGKILQLYCEIFQYMCRNWVGYDPIKIDLPQLKEDEDIIDVRQNKNNINIEVCPRHSKSLIFNVMGPVWLWLSHPIKGVSVSHTGALAAQMNSKRYAIVNSDKFKELFPEIHIVVNTSTFIKDSRGGELYSINRNAFTGYGGDVIINDDLTNAESARKDQAEMANAWSYYQNTLPSRVNDPKRCIIMNIQQRLAPNDIAGHIKSDPKLSSSYVFVTLPAKFEKTTYAVLPISGEILKFEKGSYLWPERFGDYTALRNQVGETIFETQYMQKPIASDRTVIKADMIIEKDLPDTPGIESGDIIYASHDFPVKDKETSDFLGSALGYRYNSTLYIADSLEKKMAFTASVNYVERLEDIYPGIIQVIEDKANGSPILQQLGDRVAGLQAYQPGTASKVQRMESASLYMISKNVVFVRTKFNEMTQKWELTESMQNLKTRLLNFPFVEHDDICDAISMLILYVFMDRRYMVYGRAFDDSNVVKENPSNISYTTIFFNKEGDIWKTSEIGVIYNEVTKLIQLREIRFKASVEDGLKKLKEFAPKASIFIDCSVTDALQGMYNKSIAIEKYNINDFDQSVSKLNQAFSMKRILINKECQLTKGDIESFKFVKSKDDTAKYATQKDGFVANLRMAIQYYGGVV